MEVLPFVVYWLISKDVFFTVDPCQISTVDTGFCLSEPQCLNIVNGTNIGSCSSEDICCKIAVEYLNDTYHLSSLFVKKSQSDALQQWIMFNAGEHENFKIRYRNRSLIPERSARLLSTNSIDAKNQTPDRIISPITAKTVNSEDNMDPYWSAEKDSLYTVILEKVNYDNTPAADSSQYVPYKILVNDAQIFEITLDVTNHESDNLTEESASNEGPSRSWKIYEENKSRKPRDVDVLPQAVHCLSVTNMYDVQKPVITEVACNSRKPAQSEMPNRIAYLEDSEGSPADEETEYWRKYVETGMAFDPADAGRIWRSLYLTRG